PFHDMRWDRFEQRLLAGFPPAGFAGPPFHICGPRRVSCRLGLVRNGQRAVVPLDRIIAQAPSTRIMSEQERGTSEETLDWSTDSTEDPARDLTGTTLGDFQVKRLLGRGGMGQVYLATQTSLNRSVALKVLHPRL